MKSTTASPATIITENEASHVYEESHVHEVYNNIASHFSQTRYKPWPVVDEFLRLLPPGSIGFDVGCGNGKYLGIRGDVFIVASDRSSELVRIASTHEPHDTIQADALSLPHPDATFDFAISIAVIHHLSTPARRIEAVRSILRTLRPKRRSRARAQAQVRTTTNTRSGSGPDQAVEATTRENAPASAMVEPKSRDGNAHTLNDQAKRAHSDTDTDTDTSAGQALFFVWALEQKGSRRGWDAGDEQDVLVPWVLKPGSQAQSSTDPRDKKQKQKQRRKIPNFDGEQIKNVEGEGEAEARADMKANRTEQQTQADTHVAMGNGTKEAANDEQCSTENEQAPQTQEQGQKTLKQKREPPPEPKTYHRYYHLYHHGELESDILAAGGEVVRSGYDRDNWWCIARRGR